MGERLAVDPNNNSVLYFGAPSGNGLWRSTDGGASWTKIWDWASHPNHTLIWDWASHPNHTFRYTGHLVLAWLNFGTNRPRRRSPRSSAG